MLAGCASTAPQQVKIANQELIIDEKIHSMSRNEVILAVKECESSGLRAVVIHGKRKVNGFTTDVVVDVTCAPRFF
ncbi:MAG: hypothetical protein EBT15_07040 [Betaproteobacteria bacterium]|nr:hypothetical protein [Betaproteobacteria bacterium]